MWEIPAGAAAISAQYGPMYYVTGSYCTVERRCFCGEPATNNYMQSTDVRCASHRTSVRVTADDLLASMLGPMEAYTQVNVRREMIMGAQASQLAYQDFICYLDRPENKLATQYGRQIALQRNASEQYQHFLGQQSCVKAV